MYTFPGNSFMFQRRNTFIDGERKWISFSSLFRLGGDYKHLCAWPLLCLKSDCCTYIRPAKKRVHLRSFYDFSFNKRWFWQCANVRFTVYAKFTFVILDISRDLFAFENVTMLRSILENYWSIWALYTQPNITAYVYSFTPFQKGSRRRTKNKHIKWNIDAEKHWQFKLKSYNIKDYRTKGSTNVQVIIEMRSFSPFSSFPFHTIPFGKMKWLEWSKSNVHYVYAHRCEPCVVDHRQ